MNDQELLAQIQNNDQLAFKELVKRYQKAVVNTCMGFVHNTDDARDLAQEVFIEVYQSIAKFRGDAKLSTWIYRIAVNKSLNFLRSHKKNSLLKSIEQFFKGEKNTHYEIAHNQSADSELLNNETAHVLNKALESLPENQRIAFVLSKYDEMPYAKISEVMDISVSSVESLLFRAKKNLQTKLVHFYTNKPKIN